MPKPPENPGHRRLNEAEAAALANERRLRLFLEDAKDYALMLLDTESRIVDWLGAAETITGWSAAEVSGRSIEILFTDEDRAAGIPQKEKEQAARTGRAEDRRWHVRKDSSLFFAEGVTTSFRDEAGELQGFGKIFRDSTLHKQAEAALQDSERRLRFVMDAVPQKLFTTTPDGNVSYVNSTWLADAGQTFEQIRDWGWTNLVHPEDLENTLSSWRHSIATGTDHDIEHRFRAADGSYRWHLSRAVAMRDDAQQIIMWVGSNTDIDDVKTAEVKLGNELAREQENTARLTKIAQASRTINSVLSVENIAQVLAEESRNILRVHQTVVSLTVGRSWEQAINAVSLSDKYAIYRNYHAVPDGSGIYAEVCRTRQSMRFTQQQLEQHPSWKHFGEHAQDHPPMRGWLAVPLLDREGEIAGLIQASDKYEDEFTEADEAILQQLAATASIGIANARLYDSLREQDRHKDEFIATLAHELRNPLAPLRTGVDILAAADGKGEHGRVLQMMQRQLAHMVHLIDDLMDVSRVSSGKVELKRERISLRTIIDTALEATEPTIKAARHQLQLQIPGVPLYLLGDLTRLAQVISNLLNNAAKYTPEGGTIMIAADQEEDQVVLRISDNGVGISKDMLPKVFELFTQAEPNVDRAQGGLGIGLSLVRKLVEMHGGSVTADSPGADKGSTFTLRLPLLQEPQPQPAGLSTPHREIPISGKRLLVVDDNIDAAETLAMLLRFYGHDVYTAHSGTLALELALALRPDAIFLDLGLPGLSGYQVAQALRREPSCQQLVLIALTGWGNEEDRQRSEAAGFNHHLVKPADAKMVGDVLRHFFEPEKDTQH